MKNLITRIFDTESKFLHISWAIMFVIVLLAYTLPVLTPILIVLFFANFILNGVVSARHFYIASQAMIEWFSSQALEMKEGSKK